MFVQSTKNPLLVTAVRNKCFHKALYNLNEPDEELIKKVFKEFQGTLKFFDQWFFMKFPKITGNLSVFFKPVQ